MNDKHKTKDQLIVELTETRQQVAELKASMASVRSTDGKSNKHLDNIAASNEQCSTLQNKKAGIAGTIDKSRNNTKYKRTQQHENEQLYRMLVENSSDVTWVIDMELHYTYVSPSATLLLGYSAEEMMSQTLEQTITPASYEVLSKILTDKTIIEHSGQNGRFMSKMVELEFSCKDGSTIWTESNLNILRNHNNQPIGIIGVTRDISCRKETEKTLREIERRYKAIFDNRLHMIYVHDEQLCFIEVNDCARARLGYDWDDLGKVFFQDIIHPEDIAIAVSAMQEAIEKGSMDHPREMRCISKYGEVFWVDFLGIRLSFDDEPFLAMGIARDITDRKQAEERLRESEMHYRLLAENTSDIIWTMNMSQQYTYISPSITKALGYSVEEAMPLSLQQVLTPASYEVAQTAFNTVIKTVNTYRKKTSAKNVRQRGSSRSQTLELELYHKDGSTVWTETTLNVLSDDKNQPIGIVGVTRDISARMKAEEYRREAEQRYQAIYDNPLQMIYIHDELGRFIEANKCGLNLLGYTQEDLGKVSFADIIHPEDLPRALASIYSMDETIELRLITSSGETIWTDTFGVLVTDTEDKIRGLGIARDITDRKRAEEQLRKRSEALERSNKDLEQFAYVASHDLQEPLRMIGSYVQLLAQRYKGKLDADADDFIGYAVDGANRMQKIIIDLLAYSRVGTHGNPFEPVDSEFVLLQTLKNLQIAIEETNAVITYDPLPTVIADTTQLSQLFQNLIGNAIRFRSQQQPQIHISAKQNEYEWIFSVRDNGMGIDQQYSERIFVIFQRLHDRAEYPGTGIGLAICKRIVERHSGQIWVESEEGQGSVFYFTIPIKGSEQ